MACASSSDEPDQSLPKGFTPLADIVQGKVQRNVIVTITGIVYDARLPIATQGKDYKSAVTLHDLSTAEISPAEVTIFRPQQSMPQFNRGDVVFLRNIKVQLYQNMFSLLTNRQSVIDIFPADELSNHPAGVNAAAVRRDPNPVVRGKPPPTPEEGRYASWLYHTIDERFPTLLPSRESFQVKVMQSRNVKDKFSELKDIKECYFYDFVVQAVRDPHDDGSKVALWVTDYTENMAFFNHQWTGQTENRTKGDEYGYTTKYHTLPGKTDWLGPYGKRSLQITCYEPHATEIKNTTKRNTWLKLRNVQVKYGSNGQNLEGFLREDQRGHSSRIQVEVLELNMDDPPELENNDPRLTEALRRKRDYEKARKSAMKQIQSEVTGKKRKQPQQDGQPGGAKNKKAQKSYTKLRREQLRNEKQKQQQRAASEEIPGLNNKVVSNNPDEPLTPLSDMLRLNRLDIDINGSPASIEVPFTCAKYRAVVRVTDFYPNKLEHFACFRRRTEFDLLDDGGLSSDEDADSAGEDSDLDSNQNGRVWEWRFALRVEDASPEGKRGKHSLWTVVNNQDAQLLTGLDACDLRRDQDTLATLRERLFILWGDLEEVKAKRAKLAREQDIARRRRLSENVAPPDSDEETPKVENCVPANLPFTCCICQYGVRVPEDNPAKADAGEGRRWQRQFGLFDTKISAF